MNLLIISHTPHYRRGTQIVGWGPTIREIDQLADLFDQVWHLAVLYEEESPSSSLPYLANNISLLPIRPAGGETLKHKWDVLRASFGYWRAIRQAVSALGDQDMLHVRCPANISLLALLYLCTSRQVRHRWIKYAGNWQPTRDEPLTYRLQRWILRHNLVRGVVTVNGKWNDQKNHVYSFLNPSLTISDLLEGEDRRRNTSMEPVQLLYVGRVEAAKGCGRLLTIASALMEKKVDFRLHIIGDGEERLKFESMVKDMGLANHICFHGWLSHFELTPFYKRAHLMVLPTAASEGWPKVLSEAMAYGVVPLAGNVSSIPQILEECRTGMALNPLDIEGFVNGILTYVKEPDRWQRESQMGRQFSHRFTYEAYLFHLRTMVAEQWGIQV